MLQRAEIIAGTTAEALGVGFPVGSVVSLALLEEGGNAAVSLSTEDASPAGQVHWVFAIPITTPAGVRRLEARNGNASATALCTVVAAGRLLNQSAAVDLAPS